jgi:hypothetical protein
MAQSLERNKNIPGRKTADPEATYAGDLPDD